jgi:hypothetical protein
MVPESMEITQASEARATLGTRINNPVYPEGGKWRLDRRKTGSGRRLQQSIEFQRRGTLRQITHPMPN